MIYKCASIYKAMGLLISDNECSTINFLLGRASCQMITQNFLTLLINKSYLIISCMLDVTLTIIINNCNMFLLGVNCQKFWWLQRRLNKKLIHKLTQWIGHRHSYYKFTMLVISKIKWILANHIESCSRFPWTISALICSCT